MAAIISDSIVKLIGWLIPWLLSGETKTTVDVKPGLEGLDRASLSGARDDILNLPEI